MYAGVDRLLWMSLAVEVESYLVRDKARQSTHHGRDRNPHLLNRGSGKVVLGLGGGEPRAETVAVVMWRRRLETTVQITSAAELRGEEWVVGKTDS
jgi:hypothetical protein